MSGSATSPHGRDVQGSSPRPAHFSDGITDEAIAAAARRQAREIDLQLLARRMQRKIEATLGTPLLRRPPERLVSLSPFFCADDGGCFPQLTAKKLPIVFDEDLPARKVPVALVPAGLTSDDDCLATQSLSPFMNSRGLLGPGPARFFFLSHSPQFRRVA